MKTNHHTLKKTVGCCLAFLLFFSSSAFSQPSLSLKECIELARKSGPNAMIARSLHRSKTFIFKSFNSSLFPQLLLSGTIPDYERAINPVLQNNGTTEYIAQSQSNSSLALFITQPLELTGGSLFISSSLSRTDLFGNEHSIFWRASPLVVGIRQPLFQLNTLWWDNKSNELQYEESEKKYLENLEDAAIEATRNFFDVYVAQMRLNNADLNVSINDTLLTISRGRYEVGKIDENDLLQSELALANAKTQLSSANLDYKIALRSLATTIGKEDHEVTGIIPPEELPIVNVSMVVAIEQARKNRSDLVSYELQKHIAERNLRTQELSNGFNATITASFGLNQTATELNTVYHNPLDQQAARLDFSVPLFQWGKGSSAIAAAREELDRSETSVKLQQRNFDHDVEAQVERFLQNQQQLTLSLKADTIAQKQYLLAKNRYLIGRYDVTKLLLSQDAKDRARESLIITEQNYWLSYYRLRRLTLYDFETSQLIRYEN